MPGGMDSGKEFIPGGKDFVLERAKTFFLVRAKEFFLLGKDFGKEFFLAAKPTKTGKLEREKFHGEILVGREKLLRKF